MSTVLHLRIVILNIGCVAFDYKGFTWGSLPSIVAKNCAICWILRTRVFLSRNNSLP